MVQQIKSKYLTTLMLNTSELNKVIKIQIKLNQILILNILILRNQTKLV